MGISTKPESKEDQTKFNKEYEGWVQELQTQYFFSATYFLNTDFKEEANLSSFLLDALTLCQPLGAFLTLSEMDPFDSQ